MKDVIWMDRAVKDQKAKVIGWGFAKAGQKKTDYLWVNFVFLDAHGDNNEDVIIQKKFYLTEKTIDHVLEDLSVLGWNGRSIYELDQRDPNAFDLGKKIVLLTTELESYNGKDYCRVVWIDDPENPRKRGLPPAEMKRINTMLENKIAVYRAKHPVDQVPQNNGVPAFIPENAPEESIPF